MYCVHNRLNALKDLLQKFLQAEDFIKVHEIRLMEKETSSNDPQELEIHWSALRVWGICFDM